MGATDVVEDYLLAWILLAVALGVAVPELAVLTRASTPILAVMIGSISLTLSVDRFRQVTPRTLAPILAGHLAMPVLAAGVAWALGLGPTLTVGFVVLGAVTPELVTPVMTELSGGDTALATSALVVVGLGSVVIVPGAVALLAGDVAVPTRPIVEGLALAVVAPMVVAVGARTLAPGRVGRHDDAYPAVAALAVIVIIGGVTAANATLLRADPARLLPVLVGALALNLAGYGLGHTLGRWSDREAHIATVLSVGMRDFAVAAALVVAAGLPPLAALPAVTFGVVEMTTSAGLARWYARDA